MKICVITGAARGIGRAIAERFHDEGAIVILTDIDETAGVEAATAIGCRFERLDVREEADWQRLAEIVPVVDVLVNNAGVTGFEHGMVAHDPEHASLSDWRAVHAVNLDGTFLGCRYAIGAMKVAGRLDHQHLVEIRAGRDSPRRGLCVVEGGDPQSQQDGGAVLRAAGVEDPLQLGASRGDPDADLGADARGWCGPGGADGSAGGGYAVEAVRDAGRGGRSGGDARVGRGDLYYGYRDQYRWRLAGRFGRIAGVTTTV
jgi:NAD(P)-dependent dehydrogenase (short-subunit alcohol dehydrogenase family)